MEFMVLIGIMRRKNGQIISTRLFLFTFLVKLFPHCFQDFQKERSQIQMDHVYKRKSNKKICLLVVLEFCLSPAYVRVLEYLLKVTFFIHNNNLLGGCSQKQKICSRVLGVTSSGLLLRQISRPQKALSILRCKICLLLRYLFLFCQNRKKN